MTMTKTTKRLGKPYLTAYRRCEADTQPSEKLTAQWKELDKLSNSEYGKPYDALKDAQKIELHFNINSGKFDADKK